MPIQGLLIVAVAAAALLSSDPTEPGRELAEQVAQLMIDEYVDVELGRRAAEALRDASSAGRFDGLSSKRAPGAINLVLRNVTQDKHCAVVFRQDRVDGWTEAEERAAARLDAREARRTNYGVQSVSVLDGNVGLVEITAFYETAESFLAIDDALDVLRHTDAIIVDLRANGGGMPEGVARLCSAFFPVDAPVLLNTLVYERNGERADNYTDPALGRSELIDQPLYLLISGTTFSGAEECAYDLQTRERATVVGVTSGGGAHLFEWFDIDGGYRFALPIARAVNPVTGTNWERVGVRPDVSTPAKHALAVAHVLALRAIANRSSDPDLASESRALADRVRSALVPSDVDMPEDD